MRKRGTSRRPVSVRPPFTLVYISKWLIVKLLSRLKLIAPYHSSFLSPSTVIHFQGEPPHRGVKYTVGQICDFRLKSPFIPKIGHMVAMER